MQALYIHVYLKYFNTRTANAVKLTAKNNNLCHLFIVTYVRATTIVTWYERKKEVEEGGWEEEGQASLEETPAGRTRPGQVF